MIVSRNFSNAPGISKSGFTLSNIIILSKKDGKALKALNFSAKALDSSDFSA